MGKNKRRFIDKKHASRYTLMHRSQRDVGEDILDMDVGSMGMILWPDPNNNPDMDRKVLVGQTSVEEVDRMKEWRNKLAQVGLLEERREESYLKPITGTGTFLSASGAVENSSTQQVVSEDLLAEVNQQFEGIPLAADCIIDEDIERALMGDFEDGEFEEIADDFVFEAAKEPEQGDQEAFDFDAHIAKLMEAARQEANNEGNTVPTDGHEFGARDMDFFAKAKPLHLVDEEEEEDDSYFEGGTTALDVIAGVVPSLNPDEERALCEQFERTLAEYDSDDMGEMEEEEIQGDRPLEGDALVDAALDDFLQEKEDDIFIQGRTHEDYNNNNGPKGGSGFSALVGTRMIPVKELEDELGHLLPDEPMRPLEEVLREAKTRIQAPLLAPPPEEIFIDGKSYYSMKERNPWDCESILSTYSNLDNNPVVIQVESRRKKKKNRQKIVLSSKTGLPTLVNPVDEDEEVFDDDDNDNDQTMMSVNRGVPRSKEETMEDKRARKGQVKKERQMARIQKKATKEVFKEEFLSRTGQVSDDVAGKAVFRYS
jgi:protein LTV1